MTRCWLVLSVSVTVASIRPDIHHPAASVHHVSWSSSTKEWDELILDVLQLKGISRTHITTVTHFPRSLFAFECILPELKLVCNKITSVLQKVTLTRCWKPYFPCAAEALIQFGRRARVELQQVQTCGGYCGLYNPVTVNISHFCFELSHKTSLWLSGWTHRIPGGLKDEVLRLLLPPLHFTQSLFPSVQDFFVHFTYKVFVSYDGKTVNQYP